MDEVLPGLKAYLYDRRQRAEGFEPNQERYTFRIEFSIKINLIG